jgi:AraC family transcriptional regulator
MEAPEISVLHKSDFYRIRDFKCNCTRCSTSDLEYNDTFCICFVRSGYFQYRILGKKLDTHVGRALISKPDFEHTTYHIDNQPDICTVIDFSPRFYDALRDMYGRENSWFFNNSNIKSLLLQTSPTIEYYHRSIVNTLLRHNVDSLLVDETVIKLVDAIMRQMGNEGVPQPLSESVRKYHLNTIEKATQFILNHFQEDIGLQQLADHCCVSVFHFSRIFKAIMQQSPYQYLTAVRMTHARTLLETTPMQVKQIAGQSGFKNLEQFSTTYHRFFEITPSQYRKVILSGSGRHPFTQFIQP